MWRKWSDLSEELVVLLVLSGHVGLLILNPKQLPPPLQRHTLVSKAIDEEVCRLSYSYATMNNPRIYPNVLCTM